MNKQRVVGVPRYRKAVKNLAPHSMRSQSIELSEC